MSALVLAVSFFDRATEYISGSPLTYAVVFLISGVDAFFPLVPSETAVITAGTLAGSGDLLIYLIIPLAALGAFAGDNVSYALGSVFGERAAERVFTGEKSKQRLEWARRMLDRHGGPIIVAARFIPGGRTATTFAAGTLEMTWRRFAAYDALGVTVWAVYAGMIGYLGGAAFKDDLWKALLLGFGGAVAITALVEVGRRLLERRSKDAPA